MRARLTRLVTIAPFLFSSLWTQEPSTRVRFGEKPKTHAKQVVQEEEEGGRDFPALREDWFRAGRKSEGTQPAAQLRHQALSVESSQVRFLPRGTTSVPQWQEIGPRPQVSSQYGNLAGRVTAVAVDTGRDPSGNTVYVGTAYGGVWKSTNGLSSSPTFVPITESAPTLSVGALALDSSTNPTTIYVGTGEPDSSIDSYYGIGVMKSTDGGATWSTASIADGGLESFYGQSFSKLLVDPTVPQVLLACTRSSGTPTYRSLVSGLYRSVDWGATWHLVYPASNGCSDLVYQPATATYFAALRGQGLFASGQAGLSWLPANTPFPSGTPMDINNARRIALTTRNSELWAVTVNSAGNLSTPVPCNGSHFACDTGLSLSNDGGHTWIPVNAPSSAFGANSQGWYDLYVAAPGNSGAVAIGGIDLWLGQWDGTNTANWVNTTNGYSGGGVHPDQHALAVVDDTHWYIGNDGGLWITPDAGQSWQNGNATLGAIQFTGATADPSISGLYFGGSQDNGTAISGPYSSIWNTAMAGDGGYVLAAKRTIGRFYGESFAVSLKRTDDRGASFSTVVDNSTIPDFSGFYVPFQFTDSTEAKMLLGTCRVWRGSATSANGAGWQPISGDLTNNSCNSYITAIAVATTAPDTVYVGTRNGLIWQSKNATAAMPTWTNLTTVFLPSRPVSSIAINPTDPNDILIAYQGFDSGHVFRRGAKNTWQDVSGSLPNLPANSIAIDPQQPSNVYVGTDAGVYAANDGGTAQSNWQPIGSSLPNTAVVDLKIVSGSTTFLLAATHGRGAWTLPLSASTPLGTPSLLSPANTANVDPTSASFSWTSPPNATSYRLMVAPSTAVLPTSTAAIACAACVINVTTTSPNYTAAGQLATNSNYNWQVIAYGAPGQSSPWTVPSSFTTNLVHDILTFSPGIATFGNTGLFTSQSQIVQVTNSGTTAAALTNVSLTNSLQFSVTNNCPPSLAANALCQLNVTFAPQAVGTQQSQLTISNPSNSSTNSMLLSGTAVYSSLSMPDTTADFGSQPTARLSNAQTIPITNPGFTPLVLGLSFPAEFPGTTDCPAQLTGGATCNAVIKFRPSTRGTRSAALLIYDNTAQGQHFVSLTGRGDPSCGRQSSGISVACAPGSPLP